MFSVFDFLFWIAVNCCRRDVLSDMENKDKVVNIDNNDADPHLIAMFVVISTSIFVPQR